VSWAYFALKVCLPAGSNSGEDRDVPRVAVMCADDAVIKRCVAGDGDAWRALHRTLYPTAAAFLRQMGVRAPELEDVCQEVFLQVFRYLGRFQQRSDLTTWVYKICISQAARLRRRQRVTRVLEALFGPGEAAAGQASLELSEGEITRRVRAALAQLSPRHREVFVLYELEGISGEQIARVVDCPIATVWSRLHYARLEFQRAVDASSADGAWSPPRRRADASR
jgi:RNA polymerase sigma-70 factor, ECF subfamily